MIVITILAICFASIAHQSSHAQDGNATAPLVSLHGTEIWRVGGDEEGPVLGAVADVIVDEDQNVYVLDSQLCRVLVFDGDGRYLRDLGGEGDGPGEFRHPSDLCFLESGVLGVAQIMPGKLVGINIADGTPAAEVVLSEAADLVTLVNARSGGGNLVLGTMQISANLAQQELVLDYALRRYDYAGTAGQIYCDRRFAWRIGQDSSCSDADFDFAWQRLAVAPDGCVAVAPDRNAYTVTLYDSLGEETLEFTRDVKAWQRSPLAHELADLSVRQQATMLPGAQDFSTVESAPVINEIHWRPDRTIWIQTTESVYAHRDGVFTTFDVFDEGGKFQHRCQIEIPGNPVVDLLVIDDNDRALVVYGYLSGLLANVDINEASDLIATDGPIEVVCYQLGS